MATNQKSIDPIANMRNSNKLPKAVKDYYNLIILKGRMVKKTPNKFLATHGVMVVGNHKIVRLAKDLKKKSKSRRRSK